MFNFHNFRILIAMLLSMVAMFVGMSGEHFLFVLFIASVASLVAPFEFRGLNE